MAGFADTFENDLCKLLFNGTAIANIADNAAAAPSTNLWLSLHETDPTDTGTQGSGETAYTGYTRIGVARTSTGFVVTGNSVSPNVNVDFPQATSTSTGTLAYASIGLTSNSTGGTIIASGAITPTIAYGQNVTPRLTTGSSFTLD
jgi:hypothetical protein